MTTKFGDGHQDRHIRGRTFLTLNRPLVSELDSAMRVESSVVFMVCSVCIILGIYAVKLLTHDNDSDQHDFRVPRLLSDCDAKKHNLREKGRVSSAL